MEAESCAVAEGTVAGVAIPAAVVELALDIAAEAAPATTGLVCADVLPALDIQSDALVVRADTEVSAANERVCIVSSPNTAVTVDRDARSPSRFVKGINTGGEARLAAKEFCDSELRVLSSNVLIDNAPAASIDGAATAGSVRTDGSSITDPVGSGEVSEPSVARIPETLPVSASERDALDSAAGEPSAVYTEESAGPAPATNSIDVEESEITLPDAADNADCTLGCEGSDDADDDDDGSEGNSMCTAAVPLGVGAFPVSSSIADFGI